MNLFDTVPATATSDEASTSASPATPPAPSRRICTYKSRWGTPCDRDAEHDSLVCKRHSGGRTSLIEMRREAADLLPIALETLEDVMHNSDNDLMRVSAAKVVADISGVKEVPSAGSGIDEEELAAARRSLESKLEMVFRRMIMARNVRSA